MWEDESNCRGGRWLINLNKQQRATELDNFWLEVVSKIAPKLNDHGHGRRGFLANLWLEVVS